MASNDSASTSWTDDRSAGSTAAETVVSTSASESAASSTSSMTTSSSVGDSCTWYADESCSKPRTCSDCLNVALSSGGECAIDPNGACVDIAEYEQYLANREYYMAHYKYYPSSMYSYCPSNDSVCASCVAQWEDGESTSAKYCTGTGGCVCVQNCEVADWESTVISDQCSSGSDNDSGMSMTTHIVIIVVLSVTIALVVGLAALGIKRFIQQSDRRAGRRVQRPPPEGPQLSLSGWKSLRQNLIDKEKSEIMAGNGVTLGAGDRSQIITEADEPAVILESGEGYRPAAPRTPGATQ